MKAILILLISSTLLNVALSAQATCSASGGKCCCDATAANTPKPDTGIATCAAADCSGGASTTLAAATCSALYYLNAGACTACPRGTTSTAGNSATACSVCPDNEVAAANTATACTGTAKTGTPTGLLVNCRIFGEAAATSCIVPKDGFTTTGAPCPVGQYSKDGSACAAITGTPVANHTWGCRSYKEAAATNCAAPKDGYALANNVVTACPQGQFSTDGSACAAITGTPGAAFANCQAYTSAAATSCAAGKSGFVAKSDGSGTIACVANCDQCTSATDATTPKAATCTNPKDGWYIDNSDASNANWSLKANSADNLCARATFNNAAVAPALKVTCTAAFAGAYIDAGVAKKCPDGNGSPALNSGAAATCVACTAAKNCKTCSTVDVCTACKPGYVFNAAPVAPATECTLFDVTKKHATCKTASAEGDSGCNECDATVAFRTIETEIVAPATTATPKAVGKCLCMAGYAQKGTEVNCVPCPAGVATCTVTDQGVFTALTCSVAAQLPAGDKCYDITSATVAGFFYDSTAKKFVVCNSKCARCSSAAATACLECPAVGADWKAQPSDADPALATYLKARWLNASTCFDVCPTGYEADSTRTSCVKASGSGSSTILTIVFGLLLALLF